MKKRRCLLVFLFAALLSVNVGAEESKELLEDAKLELQLQHEDEYVEGYEDTRDGVKRTEQVAGIMGRIQAGVLDAKEAYAELEDMGVYRLAAEEDNVAFSAASAEIWLLPVAVVYDAVLGQWVLSGGGYWMDTDSCPGKEINPDGYDSVGIQIDDTSGTYDTRVVYSCVYYSDGGSEEMGHCNPSTYDGKEGVTFEYEDRVIGGSPDKEDAYLGKHFSATIVYDKDFSHYCGHARTQYTHTWTSRETDSRMVKPDVWRMDITDTEHSATYFSAEETIF